MGVSRRGYLGAIFALFLFSGATALIYQVIWLRQLILIFGSTQFATSTILSCFMAGLALGAFVGGRMLAKSSATPLKIYGVLEIGIGLYALIVPFLFRGLTPIYGQLWDAGASENFLLLSLAKFVGIGIVLLPPTVLMGASLPVLSREVADDETRIGGKVGHLYAINTFGAVAGTFIAAFVAIPTLGVQNTIYLAALTNVVIGLVAVLIKGRSRVTDPEAAPAPQPVEGPAATHSHLTRGKVSLALVLFGISGCGALILEVAWTRVLALVLGSSVYAFALMLLAFLVGLAVGGEFFSKVLRDRPKMDPAKLLAVLLASAGILSFGTAFLFQQLPKIFTTVFFNFHPSPNGWLVVQFVFSLLVMFPTTFALGGIFPAMVQIHARRLDQVAGSVGTVYASNTIGTIAGAAAAGFYLIPTFGVMRTVLGVALVELLLGLIVALVIAAGSPRVRTLLAAPMAIAGILMVVTPPNWDTIVMNTGIYMNLFDMPDDTTWEDVISEYENINFLYAAEGVVASVFVAEQPEIDNRYLAVNGKVEASTVSDMETQVMAGHLPLLFHDEPKDVMLIGLASGITLASINSHPVESIRVVEIEREMLPAARLFSKWNNNALDDPRVEVTFNDARNVLEFSSDSYDVIVSQPSNPWMTVAANLFTEEFFELAKRRVRPGGVFCQWVQNYYLPTEDMKSIVAAFRSSFRYVMLFETISGVDNLLIGSDDPLELDWPVLGGRMSELTVAMDLKRINVENPIHVLSLFRMGPEEIDTFVADAARNTDDNARVEYSAPRSLGKDTTGDNVALLRSFRADPLRYVEPKPGSEAEANQFRINLAYTWLQRQEPDLARQEIGKIQASDDTEGIEQLLDLADKIDRQL